MSTFMVRLLSLVAFPALRLFTCTAAQRAQNKNPMPYLLAIQQIITLFLRNSRTHFKGQKDSWRCFTYSLPMRATHAVNPVDCEMIRLPRTYPPIQILLE